MKQYTAEERKKGNIVVIVFLILMVAGCATCFLGDDDDDATQRTPPPAVVEEVPKNKWEKFQQKHVSAWDGSCRPVESVIKKALNDAGSYEHVETRYMPNVDTTEIFVSNTFRAKNGFGALMLATYIARVDLEGNVLEIKDAND